jgi:ceramide glucosyltransferase
MDVLAGLAALAVLIGLGQGLAGWLALRRFVRRQRPEAGERPAVSVLKPLHGDEPLLEAALVSLCAQGYGPLQIVCGLQDPADPARAVVARVQAQFPGVDLCLVVDATGHGVNRKIGNLINMLPSAKHDVLVIADSDVHVLPGYLDAIVATLAAPRCGVATLLYVGRPATRAMAALLGVAWINEVFLPGALLARGLGRQDCLGATMAVRRETLAAIGGLEALADEIADDQWLGRLVRRTGLDVRLAPAIVATTVPETTLGALWRHELRWGRTIRALEPTGFALSALQHPLAWALLAVLLSAGEQWAVSLFVLAWAIRGFLGRRIDAELGAVHEMLATRVPIWLLPLRDLLSMTVLLASHAGRRVEWRGHIMQTAPPSSGIPPR